MSVATLKGTFDSFSLPDVLRLVAASGETGRLLVESPEMGGRLFFIDGEISYGTTRTDDRLISDLARMDQISEEERDAIERRAVQLEDVLSSRAAVLDIFFRNQVTEVLVRLLSVTEGNYSFGVGVMTKHQTGYRIDVEDAIQAAATRSSEWAEVRAVVPDVATRFRMAPRIEKEVKIDPGRWAILAALGTAGSAREMAVELKIFEFEAARRLALLATSGLVVVDASSSAPVEVEPPEEITSAPIELQDVEVTVATSEEPDIAPEESDIAPEESDMTSEEAAELLGSFIALTDSDAAKPDAAPGAETEEQEDVDIAKRWRKLRKDRHSGGD